MLATALLLMLSGCAGPSRLDTDFGVSYNLAKENQILNPEAGTNLQPVSGMDGQAVQKVIDKYRKDFEKPPATPIYTLGVGTISK